MADLVVSPAQTPLLGSVPVPGDKSIAHRALMLAAITSGVTHVEGGALGGDNRSTLAALHALGVRSEARGEASFAIHGVGLDGLSAPTEPIDCGNSGTTMRLLAGLLAAQRFATTLTGDASLSKRPMERIAKPLRLRGARIEGKLDLARPGDCTAPLHVGPLPAPHMLGPIEYEMPIASAQVKSAILLSGLWADGSTWVHEPIVSRDHTERMLHALGVPVRSMGPIVELSPEGWSRKLPGFSIRVPGDLSSAAFLVAAAQIVPGSRVDVRRVGVNPTRVGLLEILRDMGAACEIEAQGDELGEPVGHLHAAYAELRAFRAGGERVTRAIDEIPIACALAARARGTTEISDAAELRVKESDRIASMARTLRAFGVACEERPDGLTIEGVPDRPLRAAVVESGGDHRVAMTAVVMGLVADGPTRVIDADNITTSFPKFVGTLRALGASIEVVESRERSS